MKLKAQTEYMTKNGDVVFIIGPGKGYWWGIFKIEGEMAFCWDENGEYELHPEWNLSEIPDHVPLCREDIVSGCLIRRSRTEKCNEYLITQICNTGVKTPHVVGLLGWHALMEKYEIKYPHTCKWQPCHKPERKEP